jgi:hypothetical protein
MSLPVKAEETTFVTFIKSYLKVRASILFTENSSVIAEA